MSRGKVILSQDHFRLTIDRLCLQLIEEYGDFENTCIVGIQDRGVLLANRMIERINVLDPNASIEYGKLDITFFRDDFRIREEPLKARKTEMDFLVDQKNVILIDDVLYTGRTIHAAMTALQGYGRPQRVELLTLVDRRFNRHLPIKSDHTGISVDALQEAYVKVEWAETEGRDRILLYKQKK